MVLFIDGFEEVEALTVVDVLRRAGVGVDMVGVVSSSVTGSHGIRVWMDKRLADVSSDDYDMLVLPGGNPGYVNLSRSRAVLELIREFDRKGKWIAAICAAPAVLAKAGILSDKRAAIYPGMEREIPYPRPERVVMDRNVITSKGPGTAMEFALKLVEVLKDARTARELAKALLVG
jgi:4-methyl-5(b-hydroxyethyl)-thiazole monophosphate biosynthesis